MPPPFAVFRSLGQPGIAFPDDVVAQEANNRSTPLTATYEACTALGFQPEATGPGATLSHTCYQHAKGTTVRPQACSPREPAVAGGGGEEIALRYVLDDYRRSDTLTNDNKPTTKAGTTAGSCRAAMATKRGHMPSSCCMPHQRRLESLPLRASSLVLEVRGHALRLGSGREGSHGMRPPNPQRFASSPLTAASLASTSLCSAVKPASGAASAPGKTKPHQGQARSRRPRCVKSRDPRPMLCLTAVHARSSPTHIK
jgi:hypothetical protein